MTKFCCKALNFKCKSAFASSSDVYARAFLRQCSYAPRTSLVSSGRDSWGGGKF